MDDNGMSVAEMLEALETIRVRRGLTQEELAHELGVVLSTYNRWILGKQEPKGVSVWRIEKFIETERKREQRRKRRE